jgi:prephenate dehydrogenase
MKVAIIGGAGQMGEWFSIFFKQQGADVVISGRNKAKAAEAAREMGVGYASNNVTVLNNADLVIVSVLPQSFEKVVKEIAPYIAENQQVIDITSVKEFPVAVMHKYIKKGVTLGTHPMFGPTAEKEGQNFVLTPTNKREAKFAREFKSMLSDSGFNVVITSPEEHDRMIAMMLSLTHFIGLVTADTWKQLHVDEHMETSSTSFRFLSEFVKSVVDSNAALYTYLQMDVEKAKDAEELFIKTSIAWRKMIESKNRARFSSKMDDLSRYIGTKINSKK